MKERDIRNLLRAVEAGERTIEDAVASMRDEGIEIEAERVALPQVESASWDADGSEFAITASSGPPLTEEQAEAGAARLNSWERARADFINYFRKSDEDAERALCELFDFDPTDSDGKP